MIWAWCMEQERKRKEWNKDTEERDSFQWVAKDTQARLLLYPAQHEFLSLPQLFEI